MRIKSAMAGIVLLLVSPVLLGEPELEEGGQADAGQVEVPVEAVTLKSEEGQADKDSIREPKESVEVPEKGAEPLEKRRKWWKFWEFWK